MKKISLLQTIILALLTLTIGLFIGLFIDYPNTGTDELAGPIRKAEK